MAAAEFQKKQISTITRIFKRRKLKNNIIANFLSVYLIVCKNTLRICGMRNGEQLFPHGVMEKTVFLSAQCKLLHYGI